tara:strand:+ start:156 stop:731 length:576 start_codon:yes stop_codon:yes gene_type:complete
MRRPANGGGCQRVFSEKVFFPARKVLGSKQKRRFFMLSIDAEKRQTALDETRVLMEKLAADPGNADLSKQFGQATNKMVGQGRVFRSDFSDEELAISDEKKNCPTEFQIVVPFDLLPGDIREKINSAGENSGHSRQGKTIGAHATKNQVTAWLEFCKSGLRILQDGKNGPTRLTKFAEQISGSGRVTTPSK